MFTERTQLRVQFRVVPVGFQNGRFEVVGHQRLGHPAEMPERILQALNQAVGRLPIDGLAVSPTRMREHDPQHVGSTASAILLKNRYARAKVDLRLLAGLHFDPPKRQRRRLLELGNIAPHAVVLAGEAVLANQVLEDPLGRQTLFQLGLNHFSKGRADAPRPGGRFGWF